MAETDLERIERLTKEKKAKIDKIEKEKAEDESIEKTEMKHVKCFQAIDRLGAVIEALESFAGKVDGDTNIPLVPDPETKILCLKDFLIEVPDILDSLSDRMRKVIAELNEALF